MAKGVEYAAKAKLAEASALSAPSLWNRLHYEFGITRNEDRFPIRSDAEHNLFTGRIRESDRRKLSESPGTVWARQVISMQHRWITRVYTIPTAAVWRDDRVTEVDGYTTKCKELPIEDGSVDDRIAACAIVGHAIDRQVRESLHELRQARVEVIELQGG